MLDGFVSSAGASSEVHPSWGDGVGLPQAALWFGLSGEFTDIGVPLRIGLPTAKLSAAGDGFRHGVGFRLHRCCRFRR